MSPTFLKQFQQLIDCDPTKCKHLDCPNYLAVKDKCMWYEVLSAFDSEIKNKFNERNKSNDDYVLWAYKHGITPSSVTGNISSEDGIHREK